MFDLTRRVKQGTLLSAGIAINNVREFVSERRLIAVSLLGKTAGIAALGVLIPMQGVSVDEIQLVQNEQTAHEQVAPSLVLNTTSLAEMVTEPTRTTLSTTKVESQAQAAARIAKEEEAKKRRVAEVATASTQASAPRADLPADVPYEQKRALVERAAAAYGIDPNILEAVWQVESGKRWYTHVRSYAGAQGPMQFIPGTWRAYAVDGNGDGVKDVYNAEDAVFAAANYLAANGAAHDVDHALFRYNHAQWYVNKVKAVANNI